VVEARAATGTPTFTLRYRTEPNGFVVVCADPELATVDFAPAGYYSSINTSSSTLSTARASNAASSSARRGRARSRS
jgi:hypothetical protein